MTLRLDIRQHQQLCVVFNLSWGKGQWCSAELPYPELLMQQYNTWQTSYLNFYRHLSIPPALPVVKPVAESDLKLRGRVDAIGSFAATEDWRSNLVQAEAQLLAEFHRWLNSSQLAEIRKQIAQIVQQSSEQESHHVDVFLTCNAPELERLPWETWEIITEFASSVATRIVRAPKTIRSPANSRPRQGRPRILAILGDETGLNFQVDRVAVTSLSRIAEIQFVGWQPGRDPQTLLTDIATAITDPRGWDVLFFAGHSNEAPITGGKLAIAPGITLSIKEIAPQLVFAREHGLQFALFNSCNGLNLAESLIDLGFSQVAVMREPIHNQVAQAFLLQFLRSLSAHQDVHESLLSACQCLKLERNLTYPSAYLIPSLFRHPEAALFRIQPVGFKQWLRQWLPSRQQAIALTTLSLLSLLQPIQGHLLEQRVWVQALYRRATGQVVSTVAPVWLVQIDDQSIRRAGIAEPNPMDRSYLATLVNRAADLNAKVIGVDYLLDRPAAQPKQDQQLAAAIQSAIRSPQPPWFVFATMRDLNGEWPELIPEVASPNWSLAGDMTLLSLGRLPTYVPLADPSLVDSAAINIQSYTQSHAQTYTQTNAQQELQSFPFTYLLALSYQLNRDRLYPLQPNLENLTPFAAQLAKTLRQSGQDTPIFSAQSQVQPLTAFSYGFKQLWLHPIIDFSIPPEQVYRTIPAWQFLQQESLNQPQSAQSFTQPLPIVMIVPGGYSEAGVVWGQDNLELPAAVRHWRYWQPNRTASLDSITGGEVHAYLLQEFLAQRLVVPIPDLWLIGLAAGLSQALVLRLSSRSSRRHKLILLSIPIVYGLISLQLYLSATILLPWLLPFSVFAIYMFPVFRKK
ncbi:CHASE2 domain-containing protein [Leptolyngbya sp. NK1-12]|uniref:CHASE2 domain-containing protein n=1 Tax=Leptolyngbya sp. NK1-12 TaxID=2547451 RepID=A0AA96WM02_9CYAN|nr:CHASE2 domain-containing protein [Leptolyngbya sp. NK1-12]